MPLDDCFRLVLPYKAEHSIQQTEQIPNDPPRMGAKSTTTSNHPSTPHNVNNHFTTAGSWDVLYFTSTKYPIWQVLYIKNILVLDVEFQ